MRGSEASLQLADLADFGGLLSRFLLAPGTQPRQPA
jgi:hypothetical protein